ncbi:antibiotic biosynthesis monooxygenase [Actinocorallia sp. API 0066]|uniref:antibiotic biosynthesis monooxygenase n=1 Tax=Actinocorallia sp. API 0066 TaxID=2896846 RepID=UPI001E3C19CF|nr:antibiotic biosynthesis monooxygenase [Actinocorallia sp. API 0066]MCD0453024.1 antibiotic biosynthesis monooxygenase [Actinocorallia sp. API 0066]
MKTGAGPELGGNAATVVISLKVGKGREDEYRRWQEKVNGVARSFPGFEDTEVYRPESGGENVWVVVYRFADVGRLTAWLDSRVRQSLLDQARDLFDEAPHQEVLAGQAPSHDVITAVISHDVRRGREHDFLRWQSRVRKAQETFPGFMGLELFKPVPGVQDKWVAAVRFDTREHLDAWLESDSRRKLLAEGSNCIADYDVQKVRSSFSGWFRFDDKTTGTIPPNWKQAMSVLLALYPTVMILNLTIGKKLQQAGVPEYLGLFIGNVLSIAVLTWLAMPLVNRALTSWLTPAQDTTKPQHVTTTIAVLLCYLLLILTFALITT